MPSVKMEIMAALGAICYWQVFGNQ